MRFLAIGLVISAALLTQPIAAQNVTVRLDFVTGEGSSGAATLATLPINRGWSDSVSSYFNDALEQRGPENLLRVQASGFAPNYRVIVQPLPIMTTDNKSTGIMVYSLTLLRPPNIGTNWVYVDNSVGYSRNPENVATSILNFLNSALRR